jgi:hypothetical protein
VTPYERMRYGRVFQKMRVKLEWSKQSSLLKKYSNLQVEKDVWLTCIPRVSNLLDYARTHRSTVEGLGPVAMHIRTHHLTVGGYLRFGLSLPAEVAHDKIKKIEIVIIQKTVLHSRIRVGVVQRCFPERIKVQTIESPELQEKLQVVQEQRQGNWIVRIPKCDVLRPSTMQGSKDAAIRLSHQLEMRVTFCKKPGEQEMAYAAQWPLLLPSVSKQRRRIMRPEDIQC